MGMSTEMANVSTEKQFQNDTMIVANQVDRYIRVMNPSYLVDRNNFDSLIERDSGLFLNSMVFYRIASCTVEKSDDVFQVINNKMEKLLSALHSVDVPFGFGVIGRKGVTNLVFCIEREKSEAVEKIINGLLSGIEISRFTPDFGKTNKPKSFGLLSGAPTVTIDDEKQKFSLSSIMKALNGENYTILFIANPVHSDVVQKQISEMISLRDEAYAVSKRNIARSASVADGTSEAKTVTETDTKTKTAGFSMGAIIPLPGVMLMPTINGSYSSSHSHSEGYTDTISKTITEGKTISADIQNGFALELIKMADSAVERLKCCQNNGVWQTAICYSADSALSRNIIKACLCSELSKPVSDKLPMLSFEGESDKYANQQLLIPKFDTKNGAINNLCTLVNSSELGLLCTLPTENVPDFELREAKLLPITRSEKDEITVGKVCDGERPLDNMRFSFSAADLNKHTFVCGLTGSGKTTTVKEILTAARKPYLVIEPAKMEYRNLASTNTVYTLGKPELNCPRINPFYIMPGISPQAHIDFLKDLFIASFSFYGPMPYILEKCLHNIYKNRGWDLTFGFHPLLANTRNISNMYDKDSISKQYAKNAHKLLFPTMQDLKNEIERYVAEEMDYDGEVSGNVKTALKARLENLCVGAKGYMFNTVECIDMSEIMHTKTVLELEGLADDADKAFCVGLILVLINEYRQVQGKKKELEHLLVIEEAHRLLKNVNTERTSEDVGNPKGKAVEHFTNVIAEMRSYGQGVIVAEQIPSKLAPDVIKNSSNKIVHRIVARDDQEIIANTVGLADEDAVQLGTLKTGYAICHKEGMALPSIVKMERNQDVILTDEILFLNKVQSNIPKILYSKVESVLGSEPETREIIVRLLNSIMAENAQYAIRSVNTACRRLRSLVKQKNTNVAFESELVNSVPEYLAISIIKFILSGVYSVNELPDNKFYDVFLKFIATPDEKYFKDMKKELQSYYREDLRNFACQIVYMNIRPYLASNIDVRRTVLAHFIEISPDTFNYIMRYKEDR